MTDRPVIFSSPMVRALLEGRKTMTRRLAWQQPRLAIQVGDGPIEPIMVPSLWQRVRPADRLYVRESFFLADAHLQAKKFTGGSYKADESHPLALKYTGWRPSIHMPRWVSRLTLIVTAIKIEPLQAISNDDAEAEGVESELWDQAVGYRDYTKRDGWFCTWPDVGELVDAKDIQRRSFQSLWVSLHGRDSWEANPEVVALTFTVHKQNIDALPKAAAA